MVAEGRYRLDVQLEGRLFVELDGYAYHWSPEHKSHDDARPNKLRLLGPEILVYDWQTVTKAPHLFVRKVKAALTNRKPQIGGR